MKLSSGARRFEALSIAQHGEQDSRPSPGQGDRGLVVPPALTPLALALSRVAKVGDRLLLQRHLLGQSRIATRERGRAGAQSGDANLAGIEARHELAHTLAHRFAVGPELGHL